MIKEADVDGDGEINYTVRNIEVLLLTSGIRQYDSFQIVLSSFGIWIVVSWMFLFELC